MQVRMIRLTVVIKMADDVDVMVMGATVVVLQFNFALIVKVMMVTYIPQPGVKKSRNAELKF